MNDEAVGSDQQPPNILVGMPPEVSEALRVFTQRTGIIRFWPLHAPPRVAPVACASVTFMRGAIQAAEHWECTIARVGMTGPYEEVHARCHGLLRVAVLGALTALRRALVEGETERRRVAQRVRKSSRKNGIVLAANEAMAVRGLVDGVIEVTRRYWPGDSVADSLGTYRMERF